MILFVFAGFLFFLGTGYLLSGRMPGFEAAGTFSKSASSVNFDQTPQILPVVVLFGSLRNLQTFLDSGDAEGTAELINEFFRWISKTVEEYGGTFERHYQASFTASWGFPSVDGTEIWKALRCGLDIRVNLIFFNESRKTDGLKPILIGMGVEYGSGLLARLGAVGKKTSTLEGEVLLRAKALAQMSISLKTDLLVSQDVWQKSEARFEGEPAGEAKLTPHSGLISFYRLSGYRDEQGQIVTVEMYDLPEEEVIVQASGAEEAPAAVVQKDKSSLRWLVNNGSQIIGPLTPKEIASRLFVQELDFDCECWSETSGNSAQIKNSGIFSGSDGDSANLWLYDGETIHGPIHIGFLKTAIGHGALPKSSYICENSTVNGWKPLSEWDPVLFGPEPQSDALRASLAPPESREKASPAAVEDPGKRVA